MFKLISKLDKLLVLSQGYNVIVEAVKEKKVNIAAGQQRNEKVLVTESRRVYRKSCGRVYAGPGV
ncbi:MAG: hypothetical protein U5N58_02450 [Actinomycetota bacterium]|nr:hypothetical protein [Actinomycetota bacterium]